MIKELLKQLSPEQIKKLEQCESVNEIIALAAKEGIELTDEELAVVNGGVCSSTNPDKNKDKDGNRKIES